MTTTRAARSRATASLTRSTSTVKGRVQRQDFWAGKVSRVIGFVADPFRQEIDLWWAEAWKDPQKAVGMYVITMDRNGGMATHMTAVESMSVRETEDADAEGER